MNPVTPIERYLTKDFDYFLSLGARYNGYDGTFLPFGCFIGYDGIKFPMRKARLINGEFSS